MRSSVKVIFGIVGFGGLGIFLSLNGQMKLPANRLPASIETKTLDARPETHTSQNQKVIPFHFERTMHADLTGKKAKPLIDLSLKGIVFLTEVAVGENSHSYSVQFELTQGKETEVHSSHVPFVVEVSNDQNLKSVKTAKKIEKSDEDDLNVLKDFIGIYAYGSYQDTVGTYQFKITRTGNQIQKLKVAYTGLNSSMAPQILSSESKADVEGSDRTWLKGSGLEQTRLEGVSQGQAIVTTSSFKLERLSDANLKPKFAVRSGMELAESGLALIASSEIKPRPIAELKSELANIKQYSKSKRLSLFHDLARTLKADQASVLEFQKYIESVSKEPGLMTFGIGVLATAGTESAQAALRDWYVGNPGQHHTVLNSFSTADAPLSDETKAFLREIVGDRNTNPELAENAVFALGSSLKHGDDEDTRKTLLSYYATSKTESDRLGAIDAIGNSGDVHLLPTLQQAIQSGTEAERERAVFGVRFLPAEAASPILAQAYQDANAGVRQASLRALVFQGNLNANAGLIQNCAKAGVSTCVSLLAQLNVN
jgi:hypothetical protein